MKQCSPDSRKILEQSALHPVHQQAWNIPRSLHWSAILPAFQALLARDEAKRDSPSGLCPGQLHLQRSQARSWHGWSSPIQLSPPQWGLPGHPQFKETPQPLPTNTPFHFIALVPLELSWHFFHAFQGYISQGCHRPGWGRA